MANEDHVGIAKKNNISVTVVCDGAGGLGAGGVAAELLSVKLADYVLDKFDALYSSTIEKAKYNKVREKKPKFGITAYRKEIKRCLLIGQEYK